MKKILIFLAILLLNNSSKCEISEEFNQQILDYMQLIDCEYYETSSKSYSKFISIHNKPNVPAVDGYITRFTLFILGSENARVVFSNVESPNWKTDKGYEFGKFSHNYWGDTRLVIRDKKGDKDIAHLYVKLPPNNKTTKYLFEIKNTGYINVYMDSQTEPIISAFDPEPLRVNYISFSSKEEEKTEYFYNCPSTLSDVLTPIKENSTDGNLENVPLNVLMENCHWFEAAKWDESSTAYDIKTLSANKWDKDKVRIEAYVVILDSAIIKLSPQPTTDYQSYYQIEIHNGGEIRLVHRYGYYDSKWLSTFSFSEFLSASKQLKVIIDIFKNGQVEVYIGPNDYRPVVSASNDKTGSHPVTVKYISFTAEMTSRALHFYGCPTNNATTLETHYDILPDDGFNNVAGRANRSCKSIYTGDRAITDYFPLTTLATSAWEGYFVRMPFYISTEYYTMGSSHVLVTAGFDQDEKYFYKLVIGRSNNQYVTFYRNGQILKEVLEPSLITKDRLVRFILEITKDGQIRIFTDLNKVKPLLEVRDSNPITNLEYIAFGSEEVSITYYYNCVK
ncbi:hypothetical protein Bhyg_14720 [Pseudolycoriella hygida]|uniref:Farnesoic acid O-methyl transferase domain-containing protein n=1 Tax=Pseudolycoriella hygida TaxID=35572 RepID=A0A9Q0RXR9_9DIPT|nr:hypothetical protein Bhyg_14720 [Pseudolycoriella hygida]